MNLNDYLTLAEMVALHGSTPNYISRLCRFQRVPGAVLVGRVWYIPKATVESWEWGKPGRRAVEKVERVETTMVKRRPGRPRKGE